MRYLWMICLPLIVAGCSTSGGGAQLQVKDTTAPVVRDFAITPPTGDWHAGPCSVSLQASDDVGVAEVTARISGPNANAAPVPLPCVGGAAYAGTLPVPANVNSNGRDNTYQVTAWAVDAAGNTTPVAASLTFTVPASAGPPPPPTL